MIDHYAQLMTTFSVFEGYTIHGTAPAADDAKKTLEKLQGSWQVVSFNGQDAPSGFDLRRDTLSLAFAAPGNPTRPKTPADAELIAILKKSK